MIFYKVLVDEGFDVLNHKAKDRHEVVIAVIDQLELYRFYLSLELHFLLDFSGGLFFN